MKENEIFSNKRDETEDDEIKKYCAVDINKIVIIQHESYITSMTMLFFGRIDKDEMFRTEKITK